MIAVSPWPSGAARSAAQADVGRGAVAQPGADPLARRIPVGARAAPAAVGHPDPVGRRHGDAPVRDPRAPCSRRAPATRRGLTRPRASDRPRDRCSCAQSQPASDGVGEAERAEVVVVVGQGVPHAPGAPARGHGAVGPGVRGGHRPAHDLVAVAQRAGDESGGDRAQGQVDPHGPGRAAVEGEGLRQLDPDPPDAGSGLARSGPAPAAPAGRRPRSRPPSGRSGAARAPCGRPRRAGRRRPPWPARRRRRRRRARRPPPGRCAGRSRWRTTTPCSARWACGARRRPARPCAARWRPGPGRRGRGPRRRRDRRVSSSAGGRPCRPSAEAAPVGPPSRRETG